MGYRHRQVGWMLLSLLAAAALTALLLPEGTRRLPSDPVGRILFSVIPLALAVAAAGFTNLTVEVDRERLLLRFGLGLWRRTIPLREVESARALKIPWIWGYGIRMAPRGWLYRVGGRDGVDLLLKNGHHAYVGTDDPEGLLSALRLFGVRMESEGLPPAEAGRF